MLDAPVPFVLCYCQWGYYACLLHCFMVQRSCCTSTRVPPLDWLREKSPGLVAVWGMTHIIVTWCVAKLPIYLVHQSVTLIGPLLLIFRIVRHLHMRMETFFFFFSTHYWEAVVAKVGLLTSWLKKIASWLSVQ